MNFHQLNLFNLSNNDCQRGCDNHKFTFTFVDLFAGIGGFRIPLEELGGNCLGYSEINKPAIAVYRHNFINDHASTRLCDRDTEEMELGDITNIDKLPFSVDLIVGGVPCQPWSIAGLLGGLNDPRGQLWLDVFRVLKINQPKGFILENVKGLLQPRNRQSLNYIISHLTDCGYVVKYSILNSTDFGLPQDRDRIFIVGIRNDLNNCWEYNFPEPIQRPLPLADFIEGIEKIPYRKKKFTPSLLFNDKIPASRGRFQALDELNDFFIFTDIRDGHTTIHSWELIQTTDREKSICNTILKNRRKKIYGPKDGNPLSWENLSNLIQDLTTAEIEALINKQILREIEGTGFEFVNSKISTGINGISRIFLPQSKAIGTLTATGTKDFIATISLPCQEPNQYKKSFIEQIYLPKKYKSLTAIDYAKLQGFPSWFKLPQNESIAKHQLGNAVSIPVVYHVAKNLLSILFK